MQVPYWQGAYSEDTSGLHVAYSSAQKDAENICSTHCWARLFHAGKQYRFNRALVPEQRPIDLCELRAQAGEALPSSISLAPWTRRERGIQIICYVLEK